LVTKVKAAVAANYTKATQLTADIYVCTAENGAFV
jgi:galactokinase